MTGFAGTPDRDKTGDADEDLVDSSTGAPSKSERTESDMLADIEEVVTTLVADQLDDQAKFARRETHSDQMMVRSGNVHDPRPLVAFLYYLARDQMPVGDIETILIRLRELERDFGEYGFTNGWIARWAQDAAERLGVRRSKVEININEINIHDTPDA